MSDFDMDTAKTLTESINDMVEEALDLGVTVCRSRIEVIDVRGQPDKYWYNDDHFIVPTDQVHKLEYYAGFKRAHDDQDRLTLGNVTVFSRGDHRVDSILDWLKEQDGPTEGGRNWEDKYITG